MPDLREGERRMYRSSSGRSYELYLTGGVYSCSCPAWRNQSLPIEQRTCKHLRAFRGSAAEDARISGQTPRTRPLAEWPPARKPGGRSMQHTVKTRVRVTPNSPAPAPFKAQPATAWDRLLGKDPFGDDPPLPPFEPKAKSKATKPLVIIEDDDQTTEDKLAVLLAETWDGSMDPTGWLMSEKLDGVRAYWDGTCFRSRLNNVFQVPDWYLAHMPKNVHLDGEFWMGRGKFQETSGYVRRHDQGDYWNKVEYRAFDVPSAAKEPFTKRYDMLKEITRRHGNVFLVEHEICRSMVHLRRRLDEVEKLGGEGVMLRQPGSIYVRNRSQTLLKVKSFYDAEALIIGHKAGRGKYRGMVGALECTSRRFFNGKISLEAGVRFDVGSGLSDQQRRNPPSVGTTITFRFLGLTNKGVPRHPTFVGARDYE